MNKIDIEIKKNTKGGMAATGIFAIASLVMSGIGLISSIVSGAMNVANAQKRKEAHKPPPPPLEYNSTFDSLTYVNVI